MGGWELRSSGVMERKKLVTSPGTAKNEETKQHLLYLPVIFYRVNDSIRCETLLLLIYKYRIGRFH